MKVNIVVLNYSNNTVTVYHVKFNTPWTTDDVEEWLNNNTDYKETCCYYMCSEDQIIVDEGEL